MQWLLGRDEGKERWRKKVERARVKTKEKACLKCFMSSLLFLFSVKILLGIQTYKHSGKE